MEHVGKERKWMERIKIVPLWQVFLFLFLFWGGGGGGHFLFFIPLIALKETIHLQILREL